MPEERRAVHAYLTVAGHAIWHRMAEENGISLSGLLEQMAKDWADRLAAGEEPDEILGKDLIRGARKIDAQRRRRGAV